MEFVISPPPVISIPVVGGGAFAVRRVFCVGRNYADHVKEMGGNPQNSKPVFFTKSRDAVVPSGSVLPYPIGTADLHYEGELVVALGKRASVLGYGCGLDMTRRDLQAEAKAGGKPWDMAKNFDRSAPIGPITRAAEVDLSEASITTTLNTKTVQSSPLSHMIFSVEDIIAALSDLIDLGAGDIILTGTPAGVGPAVSGDTLSVSVTGLSPVTVSYL